MPIDPYAAPYNVRPGEEAAIGLAMALADSAATGEPVDLAGLPVGEYPVYPVKLVGTAWVPVTQGARPGVQVPSGARLVGAPGRVLVDAPGRPWCFGVVGFWCTVGGSVVNAHIEGVEVHHRGGGLASTGAPYTGDHTDGIMAASTADSATITGCTITRCIVHDAARGDAVYLGTGVSDIVVDDVVPLSYNRYGVGIAGHGNGRTGIVVRNIAASPRTKPGISQTLHVESDGGTDFGVGGVRIEDCALFGGLDLNAAPGTIVRRVACHGDGGIGEGRSGGLTLVRSPGCDIDGLWLDWTRPPINNIGKLSDERLIRLVGDCSDTTIRGLVAICRVPASPNSLPPSALQNRTAADSPASERVTIEGTLYLPPGLAPSAGFGSSCVLTLDVRALT